MPSAIETCLEPESNDWGAVSPSNASGLIEIDASPLEKIQLGFHESCGSIIIYQRNKPHSVAVHSSRSTQCASLALDCLHLDCLSTSVCSLSPTFNIVLALRIEVGDPNLSEK
ncbi:hypothetical protein BDP27DRAFT_1430167 [Rhodocollybia butyracea]|uniref:Uncharacterized protein n=1 Tax=Rhodocollybia butyracea TaxID=206335 RepID=A0A9P5PBK6_9AGAR|nr:hypothetical protein BDP27DRAFT_1430167 [Rhodocollybia butyracea]